MSQPGRALHSLGIGKHLRQLAPGQRPVERANGVLQDRLLKRLCASTGIDLSRPANAGCRTSSNAITRALPSPRSTPRDAHVPHPTRDDVRLRQILAKHSSGANCRRHLTCQFHSTLLQIQPPASGGSGLAWRCRHRARTLPDHACQVLWRQTSPCPTPPAESARRTARTGTQRDHRQPPQRRPRRPTDPHHPWKNSPIGKPSPEFIARQ